MVDIGIRVGAAILCCQVELLDPASRSDGGYAEYMARRRKRSRLCRTI
jgi:hypothetical protein